MADLLLERSYGAANPQSGIEANAIIGVIDRSNLPSDHWKWREWGLYSFFILKESKPII